MLPMFTDSKLLHLMASCGASVIMMAKAKAALAILIMYTDATAVCCYTNTCKDYWFRRFSTIKLIVSQDWFITLLLRKRRTIASSTPLLLCMDVIHSIKHTRLSS